MAVFGGVRPWSPVSDSSVWGVLGQGPMRYMNGEQWKVSLDPSTASPRSGLRVRRDSLRVWGQGRLDGPPPLVPK